MISDSEKNKKERAEEEWGLLGCPGMRGLLS